MTGPVPAPIGVIGHFNLLERHEYQGDGERILKRVEQRARAAGRGSQRLVDASTRGVVADRQLDFHALRYGERAEALAQAARRKRGRRSG